MFLSLLGQFAIHLGCMIYAVSITKPYLPKTWAVCLWEGVLFISPLFAESLRFDTHSPTRRGRLSRT